MTCILLTRHIDDMASKKIVTCLHVQPWSNISFYFKSYSLLPNECKLNIHSLFGTVFGFQQLLRAISVSLAAECATIFGISV